MSSFWSNHFLKVVFGFVVLGIAVAVIIPQFGMTLEEYEDLPEYRYEIGKPFKLDIVPYYHEGMHRENGFPIVHYVNIFSGKCKYFKADTVKYEWVLKWGDNRNDGKGKNWY